MAGGAERILRRRIKSVQSTKKITKAMELIAASRILKAQQRVNAARPYSEQITEVIRNLAAAGAGKGSALLEQRDEIRTVAFVVVAGDRGLCGGYNTNVIRAAEREMARAAGRGQADPPHHRRQEGHRLLPLPRLRRSTTPSSASPTSPPTRTPAAWPRPSSRRFEDGEYDAGRDRLHAVHLGRRAAACSSSASCRSRPTSSTPPRSPTARRADYEFEPGPGEILDRLLPRYAEARLYAALLEGSASFFAAQQRAMKSATDNAEELITKLSRVMNRARQDAITTEIMEIVGGAEALRQGQSGGTDLLADNALDVADIAGRHATSTAPA